MSKTLKWLAFLWKRIKYFLYSTRFFWKRVGFSLITMVLVIIFGFFLIKMMPGNPVDTYAKSLMESRRIPYADAYRLATSLLNYDPNESVWSQFGRYVSGIFQGNFGTSMYRDDVNVTTVIRDFLPWTLFISAFALLISFILGVLMGADLAWRRSGWKDFLANTFIVVSGAIPDYLWGMILIFVFGITLKWFPIQGNYDILLEIDGWPFIINVLYHAFLPILAFSIVQIGNWALAMRGSSIGVLGEDYIMAGKARGVSERHLEKRYLRKNAMLPLVTSLGLSFAGLFGGSSLMESIFNYPGFGNEFAVAIGSRDYFLIEGMMVFMSFVLIVTNLLVDSIYSLIDPRIRRDA